MASRKNSINTVTNNAKEECIELFVPDTISESVDFLLPEDQINIELSPRPLAANVQDLVHKSGPLYLATCLDEFSRKCMAIAVARDSPAFVDLDKTIPEVEGEEEEKPHPVAILKCYCPGYEHWMSTFNRAPQPDIKRLLSGEVVTDSNILIRINKCEVRQKPSDVFEPIFGSACLYVLFGDELLRISESFHFDATPPKVRNAYRFAYETPGLGSDASFISGNSLSFNVADGTGEKSVHLNKFMTVIPEELRSFGVYLIIQLSKVMTTDSEKAVSAYLLKGVAPDLKKHKDAAVRLCRFRQPFGISISKVFDESGNIGGGHSTAEVTAPVYAFRSCCSDSALCQASFNLF